MHVPEQSMLLGDTQTVTEPSAAACISCMSDVSAGTAHSLEVRAQQEQLHAEVLLPFALACDGHHVARCAAGRVQGLLAWLSWPWQLYVHSC